VKRYIIEGEAKENFKKDNNMSLNIQPRAPHQYRNLAPLIKPSPEKLNQLPSICSVFPEFFQQRDAPIAPRKTVFHRIEAYKDNQKFLIFDRPQTTNFTSTNASATRANSINYSMPFLYAMNGRLRSRSQSKSFLPRRKRVTTKQLQVLNEHFKKNPFPSIEQRSKLSEILDISAKSIQIWFQNKRQTIRNNY
jgi:hypothetical protein